MRKAKVLLSTITIIAIMGGVLAFKAKRLQGTYYCTSTTTTETPEGLPITCSIQAVKGPNFETIGRCSTIRTTGKNCNVITKWSFNQ